MKKKSIFKFFFFLISIMFLIILNIPKISAQNKIEETKDKHLVNLYFIHSNTCSHCKEESKFLEKLEKNYPNLNIYRYEVQGEETEKIIEEAELIYNIKINGVPITIIGEEVYFGYNENISPLKFVQTIEYYSTYSYQDKLGEKIGIKDLPIQNSEKDRVTLKQFREEYGNYTLIGNIKTEELAPNLISIIIGVLTGISPIFIVGLIVIFICSKKWEIDQRNQILFTAIYFFTNFLLVSTKIVNIKAYTLIIWLLISIGIIINGINYYQIKKRRNMVVINSIGIAVFAFLLDKTNSSYHIQIFQNIKKIYLIEGFDKISYFLNYFISLLIVQILIIVVLTKVLIKLTNKKI